MNLTDSERDSLRKILRTVYLADWGGRIVEDAHTILGKLKDIEAVTTMDRAVRGKR